MAKASPIIRSFNTGVTSPLVEGRTDIDRYPSSNRKLHNTVAAPQGPAIPRSGTELVNSIYDHAAKSIIVPFVFSETDFFAIEFANLRVRFFTETGLLTYTPVAMTVTDDSPFKFDSATLGANVGDEVAFSNFPDTYNLNGVVMKIVGKVGTVYEVDGTHPALPLLATALVARVYHIVSPYSSAQILTLRDTPSLDVVYLTHGTVKTYKLKRSDTYSWAFEAVPFVDGPYLPENEEKTTLTVSATGKATPNMTNNTTPSGVCSGSSVVAGKDYYMAFDDPALDTFWQSDVAQSGIIQYRSTGAPFICDGYSIHMAINNGDTSYTSKDYAPSDFTFEGSNDGATWTVLDKQNTYVLYTSNKSVFFKIPNTTSYEYYRLNIKSCVRNGAIKPCVRSLVMRSTTSVSLTVTASAVTGINNNQGFLESDIGRLIRIKGSDNVWRPLVITARASTTSITATLLGEPFADLQPSSKWRLGAWSDTTGYANNSIFYDDRLWFGGSTAFPDFFAASVTGAYENMAPTTETGEVLDTSGIGARLNARRLSLIKWMAGGKDGLLMGTGSQEYIIRAGGTSSTAKTITPANIKADPSSSRGSSDTPPVAIDMQVLYVQRGGRTIREFAYSYESDGYKSPSMSTLASHLGVSPFVQIAYASEPFSIAWIRRANGTVVGLTYNRDENVVGWHTHDFGGEVESIAVLPSSDQLQDVLWMIIKRTINGQTRRYVEKLTRFWDFNLTIDDAHFVDSGLRYEGTPITDVYGLQHLEGETVYGLADGIPVGPFVVDDGMVTLDNEASNIVIGLGFDSEGETARLDNGAQDGTAIGKLKRIHSFTINVWQSYGGEIGTWNEDRGEIEYVNLVEGNYYPGGNIDEIETITLFDGILGPITPAPGFERRGSVFFRRRKETPLPFNITAIMPQMTTQDG